MGEKDINVPGRPWEMPGLRYFGGLREVCTPAPRPHTQKSSSILLRQTLTLVSYYKLGFLLP